MCHLVHYDKAHPFSLGPFHTKDKNDDIIFHIPVVNGKILKLWRVAERSLFLAQIRYLCAVKKGLV